MRRLATSLALAACCGCYESRIAEAQRRTAEAAASSNRYEADEVRPIQEAVQAAKAEIAAKESEAGLAAGRLASLRQELANVWRGDEMQMRSRARAASVPPKLMPLLEKAQREAGGAAVEQRFKAAVESESLDALSEAVAGWESDFAPGAAEGADAAQRCERERVDLTCERLGADEPEPPPRFLCRAQGRGVTFVASTEEGELAVRRLEPEAPGQVRVVRRMGPDWWMIRRELPEKGERISADRGKEVAAKSWVSFVQFGASAAAERLAIAAEAWGKPVAFAPADLDGDGFEEVVEIAPDLVRAVHYSPKAGGVELWTQEETCRRVAPRSEASLAPARQPCAEALQEVKRAEEAAVKLAAEIAKAPPPQKTLEDLRDAVLACDLPKARAQLSKRFQEMIERKMKDRGESTEDAFRELCSKPEAKKLLPLLSFGSSEIKGATALVQVSGKNPDCESCAPETKEAPLSFAEGAWKLDDDKAAER